MNLLISTFIIFVVVALSNLIARYFPKFPNTYINLIAGILIGFFPAIDHLILPFHNDVFMILILAPLLFFEGQVTPVLMIRKKVNNIIGTAVILALETAIVATLIINKIFVLGVPFALIIVAIITPTDATAFDSVVQGRKIQQTIQNVLKTESLFNDATGIVLLQAAILWLQTGHLKLVYNFAIFIKMVIGGAFIGMILAFLLVGVRQYFVRSANNVISSQTLIYLLTPFCIYFTAEKLGTSGIIAVVVAGLVHNSEINRSRFSSPRQVHFGIQMVNFTSRILNSFVFVILGINLKRIFTNNFQTILTSYGWLLVGFSIYVILTILRYFYGRLFIGDHKKLTALLFALGGVHGTVTLAMTFSVSSVLTSNQFTFVILVETVAILLSMVIPTIIFRFILPIDGDDRIKDSQLNYLRRGMVEAGIKRVKQMHLEPVVQASVIYDLEDQVQKNNLRRFFKQWQSVTTEKKALTVLQSVDRRRALMYAFDAQREYLYDLANQHMINSDYIYEVYSEILLSEALVLDPKNQML